MKTRLPSLSLLVLLLFVFNVNAQTARVQVIHNSADLAAEQVDVYLNGIRLLDDFAFRTATPFIHAPSGIPLVIQVALSDSMSSADAIYDMTATLESDKTYILVADGNPSEVGYTATENFGIEVYALGREAAITSGNTDVLVHHGVTDAPMVDVNEVTGPAVLVDNAAYKDFAGYLELPTADYSINVSTADGATVVQAYDAPLATLGLNDAAITVLASGFLDPTMNSDGPSFGLFVATAEGGQLVALPVTVQPNPTARLQVIHNSADLAAEKVDVYLNDALLLDDFAFRTATPFIDAPADTNLIVKIAPSTSTSSADAIFEQDLESLTANETYIVVADGIVSPTGYSPSKAFGLEVYAMGREAASATGNTDVLVHHGSTDAPTVDVNEVTGPSVLVNNASYKDFAGYLELPTADYSINVSTANGATVVQAYDAPLATLGLNDTAITVIASGFLDPSMNSNGQSFGLFVATAAGGPLVALPVTVQPDPTARLQVIHNSADLAAEKVDVYLNDALLLDDFAFRTATPFIDAPADTNLIVKIAPSTSTSSADAIFEQDLESLTANETYIVVADGIVSPTGYSPSQAFGLEVYTMGRETANSVTNTDILVHHGSTDAPTVDVNEVTGPAVLVDNASYKDFAGYLELPTADYTINISTEDGATVVQEYSVPLATLGLNGVALTVIASGFLDPSMNSDGPAFGLYAASPFGGPLVALPKTNQPDPVARVQLIHNSADLAAQQVDVYLNDILLLDDFAFRTATPFIDAPAGLELIVKIAPSTSTSSADAIFEQSLESLVQGETYIVVADGIVSPMGYTPSQPFALEVYGLGREVASTTGNTDVLVHHGSTDAPMVDVNEVTGPAVLVDNASYKDFAGYLELPTADYSINISTADGATVVQEYSAPLATLGLNDAAITVIASGFLDPTMNSNGPGFGLYVALASGGPLVPLPTNVLSNDEFELAGISVYPNPTNDIININSSEARNTTVNVFDMLGRTVKTTTFSNTRNALNVSDLNSGVYVLQLSNDNARKTIKVRVN